MLGSYYQKPGQNQYGMSADNYNEILTYDKNGNIQTLSRFGDTDFPSSPIQIDDLTYTYASNSNKLVKVMDATNDPSGFTDDSDGLSDPVDDYTYDANGNMTSDANKAITSITYNHLNLPVKITFQASYAKSIEYVYTAGGTKISKRVILGSNNNNLTEYLNGFHYKNGALEFFPTAEGYVRNTIVNGSNNFNYVFQYKDHLGNVRMTFAKDPQTGEVKILEENHYYPFGLKHTNYSGVKLEFEPGLNFVALAAAGGGGNPPPLANVPLPYNYKYNGKEWQDELSLNLYDYGARNYDPALGRWMNIDPKSETSRRFSPYTYALNNPNFFVDPDGMQADGWIEYKDSKGKQTVTYDAEVNTIQQAKDKGYNDVKQVLPEANVTNNVNGDSIALNKNGTCSVNGGESVNPFDKPYTTEDGTTINANQSALSQLAPVLSTSGDAAVVVGVIMVCTGVGAPLGAAMITYGGYASTTGTIMDLADDANKGTLTTEKVLTKAAVMAVPEIGGAAFKALGSPAAGAVLNAATIGADRLTDEMRKSNAGPYRKN